MIAALLLLQAATGIPGFPAQPSADERLAMPHIADAMRETDRTLRVKSLDTALALLPQPTRFRGALQCMRGSILFEADPEANKTVGRAAIDECYRLNPDVPLAQWMKAHLLLSDNQIRVGALLLTSAIDREPRLASGMGTEQIDSIFRQLAYAGAFSERRALVVALAGTDMARDDPARLSEWVRTTLEERLGKQDLAGAGTLLPYVVDPAQGLAMLADRRFEPLWPRIETWAGGDLEVQRDALVRAVRSAYQLDPTLERARESAAVLARTGYPQEAVTLLERAVADFGPPRDDYDYARAVVRLGGLRAKAGERDADRILQPLKAALAGGIAGPMLINVVPNLAIDQVALGQPAAALATLDRYPTAPDKVETAAAYGYFVAIRGCALSRLGRKAEAAKALAEVRERYAGNAGASDLAIACTGSDGEVLAQWLRRVDDPETRSDALMTMIGIRAGLPGDVLSLTEPRLRAIAGRKEVADRLARYARPLPPSYLPALRRMGGG